MRALLKTCAHQSDQNKKYDSFQVTEDEIIIVDVPSYIQKFSQFIQKTPARVQANYMLWRAAAASMKYLTENARKISLKFSQKLTGKTEETPRWRTCVGATKGSLANAVGALYVRHYFQEDAKKSALEMVHDIRAEFNQILQNVSSFPNCQKCFTLVKFTPKMSHI